MFRVWLKFALSAALVGLLIPLWWPVLNYRHLERQEGDVQALMQAVPRTLLTRLTHVSGPPQHLAGRYLVRDDAALDDFILGQGWKLLERGGSTRFYARSAAPTTLIVTCRKFTRFYAACTVAPS